MRRYIFSVVAFCISFTFLHAQCLTDYTKLEPEPSIDFASGFGNSVSAFDDYLAVGIPFSDSLGRATGIVRIYEWVNSNWQVAAVMTPSNPADGLQFGTTLKLSGDYLLVGAQRGEGTVYLFKKDPGGWTSGTELTAFSYPGASNFGTVSSKNLTISDDQQTIAIVDQFYTISSSRSGAIFVYHRASSEEWSGGLSPAIISSPENDCQDFGEAGVGLLGNRLVTATRFAPTGIGRVYVFKDLVGDFQHATLEARLDPGPPGTFDAFFFLPSIAFTPEGLFVVGAFDVQTSPKYGILYFESPPSGDWVNSTSPTCYIEPKSGSSPNLIVNISSNGTDLFSVTRDNLGGGTMSIIRKGVGGWCTPTYEVIDESPPPPSPTIRKYGQVHSVNQLETTAVMGFVPHPENANSYVALKVFKKIGAAWESQLLYMQKKSSAGHYYGSDVLGFDDFLFVAAPHDGTVKPNGGAVYCYKKSGSSWQQTGKILPPAGQANDNLFGTALASNHTFLAVGASGYDPKGKIFIYKNISSDWGAVELVQEVTIPEAGLTVYAYGDNVAIDDQWLVVPYVQNSPARIILAIFKFDGVSWNFTQTADVGFASIFAKESTVNVAIGNGIIVAGGQILEQGTNGLWAVRYVLSPSDPEPAQIAPDFSHWITNGSLFGYSVAIQDNIIFIGAPMRDLNGKWDVGAVYVYAKKPDESWSSRTESVKLVPRLEEESQFFGYSVHSLLNTLIVGAPGGDTDRNGVPRNLPGRAYVFRAEDYLWQNVIPLADFTGDSFEKDYYGISVFMSQGSFFMGASIEDLPGGKLSGAVYVTPTPPLVKLEPPVCEAGLVDLFGYPFGGTWSGPGIVDAAEGIFNPALSGTGVKVFTYTTPSCAYAGVLRLEVLPAIAATILGDPDMIVCPSKPFTKTLRVQPQAGCTYQWYFRTDASQPFVPVGSNSPTFSVNQVGEYQVSVFNQVCHTLSPLFTIQEEVIVVALEPVEPTCNNQTPPVTLIASPPGGQWYGTGVTGESFNPMGLPAGDYPLTYRFTSVNACQYVDQVIAEVQQLPAIMKPEGDSFKLCKGGKVTFSFDYEPGITYNWFVTSQQGGPLVQLAENGPSLTVDQSGFYSSVIARGVCVIESGERFVDIHQDTLFVPNVFTPNGDGANEVFEVVTNLDIYSTRIFDRNGGPVLTADGLASWDGNNAAAGVYYWIIKFVDCRNENHSANGWVQLMR